MDSPISLISIVLIAANIFASYQGFTKRNLFQRYMFWVDGIKVQKQYDRLITAGFLHTGWFHLLVNMYVLYIFINFFEALHSPIFFVFLYAGSLVGGNLLALWIRQNQGSYQAVGASGAVSGLLFAYAIISPKSMIYLFFFIPMPTWLFAVLYVAFSIYGIRSQRDNIGHEAHLGGAIVGLLITLAFFPQLAISSPILLAALLVPTAAFLYVVAKRPELMVIPMKGFHFRPSAVSSGTRKMTVVRREPKFATREEEINYLLDKGYENLSRKEKERLEQLSK